MKLARIALAAALAAACTGAVAADSNVYVSLDVGQANASSACDGLPAGFSCSTTATMVRGAVGYQVTPTWAAEFRYADLGKDDISGTYLGVPVSGSYKASGYEVAAVATFPVGDAFAVVARAGVASTKVTASASAAGSSASVSSTKTTFAPGIGMRYNLTKQVSLHVDYDYYGKVGDGNTTGTSTLSTIAAGVTYAF